MPGFELIGDEEFSQVKTLFDKSGILFRHSFDALRNGVYMVRDFEEKFAGYMQAKHALAVSSGTAALRVALDGLGIGEGDEVITQAFTFVATVEAIIESKAQPIITEVDQTLNMDPEDLVKKITPKTKVIIVVHMLGVPANMDAIMKIAKAHNLKVIEDTAWGCGGKYHDQYLGTIGDAGTYSFDFAKTMTTGEGGMVLSKDQSVAERCAAYHDHGHENNPNLPRWEDSRSGSGFNYRMSEMQGAVGLAQLEKLPYVVEQQRLQYQKMKDLLAQFTDVSFRKEPEGAYCTADAFVFFAESAEQAKACREALLAEKISTKILPEAISWHFAGTWTHMPELMRQYPELTTAFAKTQALLSRSVALPIMVNTPDDFMQCLERALSQVLERCVVT